MENVENGHFVSVEYTGTLENGDVFDTSKGREPLEVQMGEGQLIKGFENALLGMALNEKKVFTIEPEDAYGVRNEDNVHAFARSEVPPEMNPEEGQTVVLTSPDGQQIPARITGVDEEHVTVDLNHPLAGESLTFDIEIVGISDTPTKQSTGCGGCGGDDESCCG